MNIYNKIGEPALLEQTAEECAELAQAALKLARCLRGENPTPRAEEELLEGLHEEIADVETCLVVLTENRKLDVTKITEIMEVKRSRWEARIKEARK